MSERVKPDARLNLPRWDAPGDTPSHYVTEDVFTRSTILRVIDEALEQIEDEYTYAELEALRARFEEADDE